jgi:hypothetical protein
LQGDCPQIAHPIRNFQWRPSSQEEDRTNDEPTRRRIQPDLLDELFRGLTLDQAIREVHRAYCHLPAAQQRRAVTRVIKNRVLAQLRRVSADRHGW